MKTSNVVMRTLIAISLVVLTGAAMSDESIGNTINEVDGDYFLDVYDHRDEALSFMEGKGLQGGGPTWKGLIIAARVS